MAKAAKSKEKSKEARLKKPGRPTVYSEDIVDAICLLLLDGASLRSICKRPDMPTLSTVYYWNKKNPGFLERYACTRAFQALLMGDDIIEVAEDSRGDYEIAYDKDGRPQVKVNSENVHRARLKFDALRYLTSKYNKTLFGDKVDVNLSGGISIYERIRKAKEGKA